jgi:hypothetical protein
MQRIVTRLESILIVRFNYKFLTECGKRDSAGEMKPRRERKGGRLE